MLSGLELRYLLRYLEAEESILTKRLLGNLYDST
jgi:hypothetical protein